MVGGNWLDPDGLYRQYGTTKAVPETAGDYLSYGDTREIEVTIDLTTLTASPVIQSNTTFFPGNCFIESVQVDAEVSATGGTSFSVGLMGLDRSTVTSPYGNTLFLSAAPIADHTTAGQRKDYTVGVSGVGTAVGTSLSFTAAQGAGYLTALAAGTYTAGKVKVRIRYRGFGTITQ
jgi:hypothetical protein